MTALELLKQTWDIVHGEANKSPGYYHRRVPLNCHFPAYAGIIWPEEQRRLSLQIDKQVLRKISLRDETKGYVVDIERLPIEDGEQAFIHITSTSQAFEVIFSIVCADILEQWIPHNNAEAAVTAIHRRLLYWRRFFQHGDTGLSREEYIGLYTELSFLEKLLDAGIDPVRVVEAWQGPLGKNQDFMFGSTALEVKSSTGNEIDRIRVTNERQLDSTGLQTLFIFHAAFDFRENSGRTLRQLVANLIERMNTTSQPARILLEERLLAAGYSSKAPGAYEEHGFTERKRGFFEVRTGFPRVIESDLIAGVSNVSYQINLAACSQFQVEEIALFKTLKTGGKYA